MFEQIGEFKTVFNPPVELEGQNLSTISERLTCDGLMPPCLLHHASYTEYNGMSKTPLDTKFVDPARSNMRNLSVTVAPCHCVLYELVKDEMVESIYVIACNGLTISLYVPSKDLRRKEKKIPGMSKLTIIEKFKYERLPESFTDIYETCREFVKYLKGKTQLITVDYREGEFSRMADDAKYEIVKTDDGGGEDLRISITTSAGSMKVVVQGRELHENEFDLLMLKFNEFKTLASYIYATIPHQKLPFSIRSSC